MVPAFVLSYIREWCYWLLLSFSLTASSSSNRDSSSSVEGSNVARFSGRKFDNSYAEIAIGSLELLTAYLANTLFFS